MLVVFGHLVARQGPAAAGWYEKARILVYLFHMPFFMYLSGYAATLSGAASLRWARYPGYVRRRAVRLLLPFAGFGLTILMGKLLAARFMAVDNVPTGTSQGLRALLWDTGASPAESVWFLAVLFVYAALLPLLGRALPVLAVALFAVSAPSLLYADRICAYFVFFAAGMLAAQAGQRWRGLLDRFWWGCGLLLACILALVCVAAFPVDMADGIHTLPYRLLMLAASSAAIPALHGLVQHAGVARSRALLWLGAASFTIYLLNTIVIGAAKGVLLRFVSWDGAGFPPVAAALFVAGLLGPVLIRRLAYGAGAAGPAGRSISEARAGSLVMRSPRLS